MNTVTRSSKFSVLLDARLLSVALALSAGAGAWQYIEPLGQEQLRGVVSAYASVSATLLGFAMAALSILAAVMDRRLIANMRKTGHYNLLLKDLLLSAASFMLVLVLSLVCLFLPGERLGLGVVATTAAVAFATAVLADAGRKFSLVMQYLR